MSAIETENVSRRGTHRVGKMHDVSRQELCRQFGEPEKFGPKTTYNWNIRFPDGSVAVIYDYRRRNRSVPKDKPTDWSIGGRSEEAVEFLGYLGFDVSYR